MILTYLKLSPVEHILKRPDSYIGSVESLTTTMWVYDSEQKRMVQREVKYVPGFYKIVDEILVNAADNKVSKATLSCFHLSYHPIDQRSEHGYIESFN